MNYNDVADVLEGLRASTRHLNEGGHAKRYDLDQVEKAVSAREHSVARLRELTLQNPDAFTARDVEELQRILAEGKRTTENLMEMRRQGWTTAKQLNKKEFVMKTFLRYGSDPNA